MTDYDDNKDNDRDFLRACQVMLDQSVEQMDAETKNALAQMRSKALAGVRKREQSKTVGYSFTTWRAVAATAVVVAVVSLALHLDFATPGHELPQPDDMLLLTETDDLAFYQDLDFYQWLELEQVDG